MKFLGLILAVFLLFYRLDSPLLWQDEGEVAIIARNINKFGLPVTWDGQTLVTQSEGQDSKLLGDRRVWSWNTWLPYYATALSFRLFSESTAAARFPFALAGLATLAVSFLLAKKLRLNPIVTAAVLATNTLFYLYARQTRYYAFSMLFPLAAYYFYFSRRYTLFFLALFLAFHSNFVLGLGLTAPLILLTIRSKMTWLFLAQAVAWLWFFHPPGQYWPGWQAVIVKIRDYFNLINSFYFPLLFAPLLLFFRQIPRFFRLLAVGVFCHIILVAVFLPFGQRYLVTLVPVFALFVAAIFSWLWHKNRWATLILLPVFLLTSLGFNLSERLLHPSQLTAPLTIRNYFFDYVSSLPRSYPGPLEGQVDFLTKEAIAGQTLIYADYEINTLRFYLPSLRFVEHPSEDVVYWLPRRFWGYVRELTPCQRNLLTVSGEKIVLDNYDLPWENMPDITYHQFVIDPKEPKVVIFKTPGGLKWESCAPRT